MSRICGICKRPPREGEETGFLRVLEGDPTPEALKPVLRTNPEPGLYQSCIECIDAYRDTVARRITAKRRKEEKKRAFVEEREENPVPDVDPAKISRNDFC